jgi:hypothetical protein
MTPLGGPAEIATPFDWANPDTQGHAEFAHASLIATSSPSTAPPRCRRAAKVRYLAGHGRHTHVILGR